MVMGACPGFGINGHSTGPKLVRTGALCRNCGASLHPESLGRAIVQLVAADDAHTVRSPTAGAFSHVRSRRALIHTNAISVTIPAPDR